MLDRLTKWRVHYIIHVHVGLLYYTAIANNYFSFQVIFRLSNKVFGKKQFHVWLDVKDIVSEPFDHAHWFHLNKLSS